MSIFSRSNNELFVYRSIAAYVQFKQRGALYVDCIVSLLHQTRCQVCHVVVTCQIIRKNFDKTLNKTVNEMHSCLNFIKVER